MNTGQEMESKETTITSVTSSVKSDLMSLQGELETFLRINVKENINKPTPPFTDPIAETVAVLQDCRKLIGEVRHLAIDRIAKRITD